MLPLACALLRGASAMRTRAPEGEGESRGWTTAARRDRWAFVLLAAFCVQIYAAPAEWIPATVPLRLALSLSFGALGLLLLEHIGRREPLVWDDGRGLALGAFLVWAAASHLWSVAPAATDTWVRLMVKVVLAWFLVVNLATTPRRLAILCLCLVAGSIVTSVGGILRYLSGEELSQGFRTLWLGAYGDPNYLAEYLAMTVPMAAAFIARRGTRASVRLLCATALILGVTCIVLTFSRGGFLGVVFGGLVWAMRERAQRAKALVLSAALAIGVAIFAPATYWERNDTLEEFEQDQSALGRVYAWHVASAANLDRPLRGVGGGAFREAWPLYAPPDVRGEPLVAHNIFLDTLGELGWVGFFLFLTFAGSATGAVFRAGSDPEIGWLARGIGASVAGFLLCNCFSGSLAAPQLFVLFGLAGAAERLTAREEVREVERMPLGVATSWGG
ncbi:MAG: O-antigen ligase family protein [Myxococcaceae bacterium]